MAQEPTTLRFTIKGDPVPKERARTYPKMTKSGQVEMINGHPVMRTRTPGKTSAWETYVSMIARQARTRAWLYEPHTGPVILGCVFYFGIPKSWPEKKKQQARETLMPFLDTPDLSNLYKCIEDGAEGVLWVNDSAIFSYGTVDGMQPGKYYATTPRVEVEAILLP